MKIENLNFDFQCYDRRRKGILSSLYSDLVKPARRLLLDRSAEASHYLDLEDPTIDRRLSEPKTALEPLKGLVVLDDPLSWDAEDWENVG